MKEREVVIVNGCRTAFGKRGGNLKTFAASELGGLCVKALLERTQLCERGGQADSLMAGMAGIDSKATGVARYISQLAGLPFDISATFVEMQCGSAIASLNHAAWKIKAGLSDIAIVGGVESHSNTPASFATDCEPYQAVAPMPLPQYLSPGVKQDSSLIWNADQSASARGITREACDEFALRSHQRLQAAYNSGLIGGEISPVTIPATRKTPALDILTDDCPCPDISADALASLSPVFTDGIITAANTPLPGDGAAFLLIMTAEKAVELGYTPYARWVGCAQAGIQDDYIGAAAALSNLKAAKLLNLKLRDFDVFECNEAFAAQNLAVIQDMQNATGEILNQAKWNPNGGSIAIGHPNGASGARLSIFAMKQLEKTGGRFSSISSSCCGGQGVTAIIENLRR